MKTYLFDTGAVTLFYAGHDVVVEKYKEIQSGKAKGIIPKIILTEYFYKTWQIFGKQVAELRTNAFRNSAIEVCDIHDDDIFNAGKYKVKNNNLSIADCIAIAASIRKKAVILTTESEMKKVKQARVKKLIY